MVYTGQFESVCSLVEGPQECCQYALLCFRCPMATNNGGLHPPTPRHGVGGVVWGGWGDWLVGQPACPHLPVYTTGIYRYGQYTGIIPVYTTPPIRSYRYIASYRWERVKPAKFHFWGEISPEISPNFPTPLVLVVKIGRAHV